jgi:IS30 family transposase
MSSGKHLTLEERERLAASKAEGLSLRAIARRLGRAASTISRELQRNALPKGGYLPVHAEGCYRERRQRSAILERDTRLGRFVRERLLEGWTPEQIAGWLRRGEERGLRPVSTETIYAFVHRPGQKGEKLWKLLPRGRARRAAAGSAAAQRHRRAALHPRPTRERAGAPRGRALGGRPADLQADPAGAGAQGAQDPVRPRGQAGRQVRGRDRGGDDGRLPAARPAAARVRHLRQRHRLRPHGLLASACSMATWFCDATPPGRKGAVENANGRLRRDLPRDLDLDALGDAELQEIVLSHNLTPRKCLGFLTPLQALLGELGKDVQIRFA